MPRRARPATVHTHGHTHSHGPAPRASRRVRITLAVLLIPMLLASVVGLVILWPHDAPERGTVVTMATPDAARTGTVTGPMTDDYLIPMKLDDEYGGENVWVMIGSGMRTPVLMLVTECASNTFQKRKLQDPRTCFKTSNAAPPSPH